MNFVGRSRAVYEFCWKIYMNIATRSRAVYEFCYKIKRKRRLREKSVEKKENVFLNK